MPVTIVDLQKRFNRPRATVVGHLRRLAIVPIRQGKPNVYDDDAADLLAESLKDAPVKHRKPKAHAPPAQGLPPPASSLASWQVFEAQCRQLAHTCRALRITTVTIETPLDGKQKVEYEQANTGEVKL